MKTMIRAIAGVIVLATTLSLWAADDGAALYKKKCSACHGANGEGKPAIKAPKLQGTALDVNQLADHITQGEPNSKPPHKKPIAGFSHESAVAVAEYVKMLK